MTSLVSIGDKVRWRNRLARVVRIAWGCIPCAAAPWWAARHLWVTLDDGQIVPGRLLVPA